MIPTLRLPVAATAAALLLGSGPALRAADDATPSPTPAVSVIVTPAPTATPDPETAPRRQAAEALLNTLHMQATVEMASKRMFQSVDQVADRMEKQPNATPEAVAEAKTLREDLHALIGNALGWETVKPDLVQAYADDFTVAELNEVDAFYHTPVGQKLVDKQPALTDKLGKTMQQRSMALIPAIRQKIQAATAKTRPTPPPAPVGVPPIVPPPAPVTTAPVPAPPAAASATPTAPPAGTPKSITPVMPVTPAPM